MDVLRYVPPKPTPCRFSMLLAHPCPRHRAKVGEPCWWLTDRHRAACTRRLVRAGSR